MGIAIRSVDVREGAHATALVMAIRHAQDIPKTFGVDAVVLAVLGRWSNKLAVRFLNEIVDTVRFLKGERAEIGVSRDEVVLKRAASRQTLEDMFTGKTAEAWRAKYAGVFDWGPDVGREVVPE